jgi:hypothetical protein
MKNIKIFICIFVVLFPLPAAGQCTSSQERPGWIDTGHLDLENSYIDCASATGYTEDEARNKALNIIAIKRDWGTGKRVNVKMQNGNVVVEGQGGLTVMASPIDEYREYCANGQHRVTLLVQTARNPGGPGSLSIPIERVNVTPDYGFSPRVFVPGMAQLHKGSKTKGFLFIAGEAALIGGVVIAESLRASYTSKINATHSAADKKTYLSNADNWQNIRNGFIAGAAALYVWNVIDGMVAKGKKHVVVLGDNTLRITPYAMPEAGGIALTLNF